MKQHHFLFYNASLCKKWLCCIKKWNEDTLIYFPSSQDWCCFLDILPLLTAADRYRDLRCSGLNFFFPFLKFQISTFRKILAVSSKYGCCIISLSGITRAFLSIFQIILWLSPKLYHYWYYIHNFHFPYPCNLAFKLVIIHRFFLFFFLYARIKWSRCVNLLVSFIFLINENNLWPVVSNIFLSVWVSSIGSCNNLVRGLSLAYACSIFCLLKPPLLTQLPMDNFSCIMMSPQFILPLWYSVILCNNVGQCFISYTTKLTQWRDIFSE